VDTVPWWLKDRWGRRGAKHQHRITPLRFHSPQARSTYVCHVYPDGRRRSVVTRPDGSQFTLFVRGDDIQERIGDDDVWPTSDPLLIAVLEVSW